MAIKYPRVYQEQTEQGLIEITDYSPTVHITRILEPSETYLAQKAQEEADAPKTIDEIKQERNARIDACKTIEELKAFLKE